MATQHISQKGRKKNIKITTIEDIEIFKALLNAKTMTGLKNKANDEIIRF